MGYIPLSDGSFMDEDVLGVVEEIRRLWPNLRVQYIDPDRATDITDYPYRILELDRRGEWAVVYQCMELDNRAIVALANMDASKVDLEKKFEAEVAKVAKAKKDKEEEVSGATKDIVSTGAKVLSRQSSFSFKDEDGQKHVVKD